MATKQYSNPGAFIVAMTMKGAVNFTTQGKPAESMTAWNADYSKSYGTYDLNAFRAPAKKNPLPALAGLLKSHAVSVGGAMMKNPAKRKRKATAAESRKFFDALAAQSEREYNASRVSGTKQRNAEMLAAMRARKNPTRRKVKTGAIASPERIALQLQFQGQWLTVRYFPVSPAGNAAAKKLAQSMHKKKGFPMRAITAAV